MMRFGEPQLNFHALPEAKKMTVKTEKNEYKRIMNNYSSFDPSLFYLRDNEKQRKFSVYYNICIIK